MDNMELDESIRVMCETILKNSSSMEVMIKSSLDRINNIIEGVNEKNIICNDDIRVIREMNRLIDSVSMYEWLLVKKIDAVEELIRYI